MCVYMYVCRRQKLFSLCFHAFLRHDSVTCMCVCMYVCMYVCMCICMCADGESIIPSAMHIRALRPGKAVCCSVLQCVAACSSVFHWAAVSVWQCAAVLFSVFQWKLVLSAGHIHALDQVRQCVALCCCVVKCGAAWCSMLQCVAVWCCVLQCVTKKCYSGYWAHPCPMRRPSSPTWHNSFIPVT